MNPSPDRPLRRFPFWTLAPKLAVLLVVPLLAACPGDRDAQRGGTVVIAEGADMDRAHPLLFETVFDGDINGILYRQILHPWWEDGELSFLTADEHPMALARSYEFFGPDSASIRYRLRTDVRWTDGEPVTAHDVAWTIETRGNRELASPRVDFNREIREVVIEDDSTVVVHFTRRYPDMLFHTAGHVAPRHVYEGYDLAQLRMHPILLDPVGRLVTNGPFRLAGWIRGQQVVLERNPDFEPEVRLDRVVFRVIPEETTRMIELQTGNVDMAAVPFHYIEDIRGTGRVRIEVREKRSYEYIAYNPLAHDFFADPEIRRALGLAIDVDALIAGLQLDEFAVAAGGPYSPIFRLLHDAESQSPLPYDTAQARRILAERGWAPGPGGILHRDGVPFRFNLLTNAENRRRVDISQIVESQWRRIGVEARLQALEFNTVIDRNVRRDFDAVVGGWSVALSADIYNTWADPELTFNFVSYDNPEARRFMELALEQPTDETAAPYWRQAAALIVEDQPYTWLFYYDSPVGVNQRVQGTRIDTLGAYQEIHEWWIES